jgi:dienelactone hydrolase
MFDKHMTTASSIVLAIALLFGALVQAAFSQSLNGPDPVLTRDVRDSGLVGRFFQPAASGERPGVVVVGGSDGGLLTVPAKQLAAAGYPALALGYFGREGLPPNLVEIPLEYFFNAIDWLRQQPGVDKNKIVIIGSSRGAEAALLVASKNRRVKGVIGFVPGYAAFGNPRLSLSQPEKPAWTFGGKPLPYLSGNALPEFATTVPFPNDRVDAVDVRRTMIEVERINGPVLLFSSRTDRVWHSAAMADAMTKRLDGKRFQFTHEHISYDDASHIILGRVPVRIKLPDNSEFYFGGSEEGTDRARIDSWERVLRFLATFRKKN